MCFSFPNFALDRRERATQKDRLDRDVEVVISKKSNKKNNKPRHDDNEADDRSSQHSDEENDDEVIDFDSIFSSILDDMENKRLVSLRPGSISQRFSLQVFDPHHGDEKTDRLRIQGLFAITN